MIDATKVSIHQALYQDPSGHTTVYQGVYSPLHPCTLQPQPCLVAIKELSLPMQNGQFPSAILQEITIQMRLEDCENICKCYGYFERLGKVCIVTELLARDLESDMKTRAGQRYAEEQLLRWLLQVLSALLYAQRKVLSRQSIAHRDLKPQNLLLTSAGKVKLVDFGSGAVTDGGAHQLTGTPLYMSPEVLPVLAEFQKTGVLPQVTGMDCYKADIYSLGVSFLHLALLEPPIRLLTNDRPSAISFYLSTIQSLYPYMHYLLTNMLHTEPSARPDFQALHSYVAALFKAEEPDRTQEETDYFSSSASTQASELSFPHTQTAPQLYNL